MVSRSRHLHPFWGDGVGRLDVRERVGTVQVEIGLGAGLDGCDPLNLTQKPVVARQFFSRRSIGLCKLCALDAAIAGNRLFLIIELTRSSPFAGLVKLLVFRAPVAER
jgi:hypothetical protein